MKHAGSAALDVLEPLLASLRGLPDLVERRRGIFYRKGRAFLHFHEDPTGLFADVRGAGAEDFIRMAVNTPDERERLLDAARQRV